MSFNCRRVFGTAVVGVFTCLVAEAATAQPKWQAFPAEQSRLVLDVPPLSRQPSRAQELTGAVSTIRMFQYTWGNTAGTAAYADIMIQQPTAGTSFDRLPDYVALIPTVWPAVKAKSPVFGMTESVVEAPPGHLQYRSLALGARQCVGFGGAFGTVVSDGRAQMGGYRPTGGNWIFGIYCPASGQKLTAEGARYVLEGLGWLDTRTAAADRARPAAIATAE
jgi:hypothetical protein